MHPSLSRYGSGRPSPPQHLSHPTITSLVCACHLPSVPARRALGLVSSIHVARCRGLGSVVNKRLDLPMTELRPAAQSLPQYAPAATGPRGVLHDGVY